MSPFGSSVADPPGDYFTLPFSKNMFVSFTIRNTSDFRKSSSLGEILVGLFPITCDLGTTGKTHYSRFVNIHGKMAGMKQHAFEGVFEGMASWSKFNYKEQLHEATSAVRRELDRTVALYVSRFPTIGYRTLAHRLQISAAMLCEILRPFPNERKRGRRKARGSAQPNRSVPAMQIAVPELRMSVPGSRHLKRGDVEEALSALKFCVVNGRADDAGEDAYQNLSDWLRKGKGTKTLLQRVGYLTQRYETLRSKKRD